MSLLDKTFDRTLDAWTHAYMAPAWRGAHLEGWLFEDAQARRAAEARLAQAGVQALSQRLQAAAALLPGRGRARRPDRRRDPLSPARTRPGQRFTLEAYPLTALLDGVRVTLQPGASDLHYDVDLRYADGREIRSRVFAPTSSAMRRTAWPNCRHRLAARARRHRRDPRRRRPDHRVSAGVPRRRRRGAQPCLGRPRTLLRAPGDPRRPARHRLRAAGRRGNRQHLRGAARGPVLRAAGTLPAAFRPPPGDRGLQPGQIIPDVRRHDGARACASRSKPSRPYRRSRPPCPASRWRRRASRCRRRRSPAAWRPWAATRSRPPRARAGRCWAPTCAAPVPPSSFPAPSTPTKPPAWSVRARAGAGRQRQATSR